MLRLWHLISAEYPPMVGGVGDYAAHLAAELAAAECEVHVWTTERGPTGKAAIPGVSVHGIPGFGWAGRRQLNRDLKAFPTPRTLVIQYVPHAFGWKAMNVPFALWALKRRFLYGDDVRIMFHEVAFPWVRRPLKHNFLAAVNRLMAWLLMKASRRAYVSIPAWIPWLARLGGPRHPVAWLPVMATVPADPPAEAVQAIRALLPPQRPVVGHFGTYGQHNTSMLTPMLRLLLNREAPVSILLIGNGGPAYRQTLLNENPHWESRLTALGRQSLVELAASLRACDLVLQPYPDGASSRRTSLLAALANGVAVVTNADFNTDPFWHASGVTLTASADSAAMIEAVERLLADPALRREVAAAGQVFYQQHFDAKARLEILLESSTVPSA